MDPNTIKELKDRDSSELLSLSQEITSYLSGKRRSTKSVALTATLKFIKKELKLRKAQSVKLKQKNLKQEKDDNPMPLLNLVEFPLFMQDLFSSKISCKKMITDEMFLDTAIDSSSNLGINDYLNNNFKYDMEDYSRALYSQQYKCPTELSSSVNQTQSISNDLNLEEDENSYICFC